MPEGPAAAPRRARRRLAKNLVSERTRSGDCCCKSSEERGRAGKGGLRTGSRSWARVAGVPGARGSAVRARAADESSPRCARAAARSARASRSGRVGGGAGVGAVGRDAVARSSPHCPAMKAAARWSRAAGHSCEVPGGRWSSIRGSRKNSFQPRSWHAGVTGVVICSRAVRYPWASVGAIRRGGV